MRTLAVALLLLAGCRAHNDVRLVFEENPSGTIRGFACRRTEAEDALIGEAVDPATRTLRIGMVIDFIRIEGGTPACSSIDLFEHCVEQSCELAPAVRRCFDVTATSPTLDPLELQAQVLEELQRQGAIVDDAPDGQVVVRAVAVRGSCAESGVVEATDDVIDVSRVVGCAHSCVTHLDTVVGDLELDLEDPSIDCAETVFSCATIETVGR